MKNLQANPLSFIAAGIGVTFLLSGLALAQPQGGAPKGQTNRVTIEYVAPKNPELQDLYEVLKIRGALEKIQKILSPLMLPEELAVKTTECGRVDAWYRRDNGKPTVTICYELLRHVLENLPKETTVAGITPDDAKIGQVLWFTLHEVGHATFDIFKIPIFANEEDAADNFATYIMLQFVEARRLIGGAAWAWAAYMQEYKRNPVVQVRLATFAESHGQPQERFYNLLCMAYGNNPVRYAILTQEGFLPAARAKNCEHEYKVLAFAFEKGIGPHIDYQMAKGIVEANWLPGPVLRGEQQK